MDAVAPALIGIGLYLSYVAWESHKNGTSPNPLTKIIDAVQGQTATDVFSGTTIPNTVAGSSEPAAGTNPPVSVGAGGSIRGN